MAIASKNSVLYSFNESMDVNVFAVTVRDMLKGHVLYKDVYDHKGPILYFIYYVGMMFNNHSLVGVYVVESFFYALFIINMYRIVGIYTKNEYAKIYGAIIAAVLACCGVCFFGGGQCEEFALPVLTGILYEIMNYFHNDFPNKMNWKKMTSIGVLSAVVFWMKYSLLGMVVGAGIAFIICAICARRVKEILVSGLHFIAGFLGMSLLTVSYFIATKSISDLFQVYFYDNIFKYNDIDYDAKMTLTHLLFSSRSFDVWCIPVLSVLVTVVGILLAKDQLKIEERLAAICMVVFACAGVVVAHVWTYSPEVLCVFTITAILSIFYIVKQYGRDFVQMINQIMVQIHKYFEVDKPNNCVPIIICVIYSIIVKTHAVFVFCTTLVGLVVLRVVVRVLAQIKFSFVIRYALLVAGVFVINYEVLNCVFFLMIVAMMVYDISNIVPYMKSKMRLPKTLKFTEKVVLNILLTVATFEIVVNSLLVFVVYSDDRHKNLEEYPQFQMAEYIKENGDNDSLIINYDCLDNGVYWLLNEYPPEGRFASNNANKDEINEMAEKWIVTQKADFVVASYFSYRERIDLEKYGYKQVFCETTDYLYSGQEYTYCLYHRQ